MVDGIEATAIIKAIATSGARYIVFAGGDPSLRHDLPDLCAVAAHEGLLVEIQTNAHAGLARILAAATHVDSVAVSLDSGVAEVHDRLRGRKGNFRRVLEMIDLLESFERPVPVRVRTLMSRQGVRTLDSLADALLRRPNIVEWALQEFVPVGSGRDASGAHALEPGVFEATADALRGVFGEKLKEVRASAKAGAYAMVRSDGGVYGTLGPLDDSGHYRVVASLLTDHLDDVAGLLPFDRAAHAERYAHA